jgi:type II secretory ATPase GspE/PulE/Tfp pilus assembly ATPase PilB-like protein/CheY-like chemotaxis protein
MHWLGDAAVRAGLKGAGTLVIPGGTSVPDAWEMGARNLGTTPQEFAAAIAPAFRLQAANFQTADGKSTRLIPEKLARRFNVFPLRDDDRHLFVATADPGNIECEQHTGFASGRRITFELAPPHLITQAINRAYVSERGVDVMLSQLDQGLTDAVKVLEELKPEPVASQDVESAPVVKLTNLILRDAVLQRASDVHIEPGEGSGIVRFRIDGVIRQHMQVPMQALNRVVSRIKVIAKLDIADRMRPQDGRTRIQVEGRTVDLRISTVPIRDAEKVVIRVLRPDSGGTLEDSGLAPQELARLRKLLTNREGIVLVTGPTGSGKTTTMYGALRELATGDVNIMTVEDPVEYELPRISQMQIDPKRGVTFASALRAILRQDPDVIFVGEIRDLETAEIAVQAAMTGHLVLATLHTNDAVSAVARLMDLGLDRAAIAATLRGSLAQRLVRKICGECCTPVGVELTADETRLASMYGVQPVMRPTGCARCANTGYFGRLPIDEVAVFSPAMLHQVTQGASTQDLQRLAIANGMRPLRTVATERVALGQTTLSELERVVGDVGPAEKPADLGPAILIADDDPVQRLLVSATLEKNGFRVAQAEDGEEALRRLMGGEECSLLLTDLHMPKMNGDMLVRSLRADPRMATLPIVVLTGSEIADRESELIDIGADDYIRKPVDPPRLLARVRAALRRAS